MMTNGRRLCRTSKRADPVGVRGSLLHQAHQLAVQPSCVFVLGCGLVQHRPHALAGMVAQQHRQQLVAVQAIGLGAPGTPVHLDAAGVDHEVVGALFAQPAMEPPAVASGFVAAVHSGLRPKLAAISRLGDAVRDGGRVVRVDVVPVRGSMTIAGRQLPLLVAKLKAHVELPLLATSLIHEVERGETFVSSVRVQINRSGQGKL